MKNVKFIIIAAVSTNGVIGVDNEIPWRIPEDFKHFRETTMGNMLLVGYNTFKTLPPKALEGRKYIVVSGDNPVENLGNDIYMFRDLDTVFYLTNDEKTDVEKIFVAGGAMIYDTMIDYCDEAIITWVNKNIPNGNKFFPIDKLSANFTAVDDSGWMQSKTGVEYKIRKYVKNNFKS